MHNVLKAEFHSTKIEKHQREQNYHILNCCKSNIRSQSPIMEVEEEVREERLSIKRSFKSYSNLSTLATEFQSQDHVIGYRI